MDYRSVSLTRSYQQVVAQIQEGIRRGSLAPGQRLPTERELGERFGVSRAVVREALKALATIGLVESRQGSGNYIAANPVPSISHALVLSARPEEESLVALFELRGSLEGFATRLAAERRTEAQAARIMEGAVLSQRGGQADDYVLFADGDRIVHGTVFQAAGNPYLTTVATAVREVLHQALHMVVMLTGSMVTAAEQHVRIAEAIAHSDPEAAATLAAAHVRYNVDALHQMIETGEIDAGEFVRTAQLLDRPLRRVS